MNDETFMQMMMWGAAALIAALVFGFYHYERDQRDLVRQCSNTDRVMVRHLEHGPSAYIIEVYDPDDERWVDLRETYSRDDALKLCGGDNE